MQALSTTKLSSKGQVVIPEDVRESLRLKAGDQFVVMGSGDTVVLKVIAPPSPADFKAILQKVHKAARRAGMKKEDIGSAVRKVRASR